MATRLNKRFIIILTAAMFVLGVLVAGVAYVAISGDAERQVRLAQELEAAGEYSDAVDRYARAIGKDPTNLDYYDMLESALLKVIPESRAEARERYGQYLAVLQKRKGASVDNPASWDGVIAEFRKRADLLGGAGDTWDDVQDQSERMLDEFMSSNDEEGQAAAMRAKAYLVNAMANRLDLLKPKEREEFDELVAEMVESKSSDPLFWEGALKVKMIAAGRHKAKGDTRLVRSELDGADGYDAMVAMMRENGTELTPEIRALMLRRLNLEERDALNEAAYQEEFDAYLLEAQAFVQTMQDANDPKELAQMGDLLRRVILSAPNTSATADLVEPLLESGKLPIDISLIIFKNMAQSNPEIALRAARHALDIEPMSVSLLAMMQSIARQQAAISIFDATYMLTTREDSDLSLVDLRIAREDAVREYEGDPLLPDVKLYLDGSIALAEQDVVVARSQLSEVAGRPLMNDPVIQRRFVPRYVTVMLMAGERGVAIQELKKYAANLTPQAAVGLRKSIAVELIRVGQLEEAMGEVQQILAVNPEDEDGLALLADLQSRSELLSESAPGAATPEARSFTLASTALADGRLEDARQVLMDAVRQYEPKEFKHMLITVETLLGNKESARQIAEMFTDPENNAVLQRQLVLLDTDDPIERVNELLRLAEDDESVTKAMRYLYLQRMAYGSNEEESSAVRPLLQQAFEDSIADLPESRNIRQRVVVASVDDDRMSDWAAGPESASKRALAALEKVEKDEVHFLNTKARILVNTGNAQEAIDILLPLDERGLSNSDSWFTKAQAFTRLGRMEEALDAYEKAYQRSPGQARFVRQYVAALENAGEQDKALGILRSSRRSDNLAFSLRDAWLEAESVYGDQREALVQRMRIFNSDVGSKSIEQSVVDVDNALELSRLMLVVPIEREDILRNGNVAYSPTAWDSLPVDRRRELIRLERDLRQKFAFGILDGLEARARSEAERVAVMMVKAQAYRLSDDLPRSQAQLDEIIECCEDALAPSQRMVLIKIMEELDRDDLVRDQYMKAAAASGLQEKRALCTRLTLAGLTDEALVLAEEVYAESGLPMDAILVAEKLALSEEIDRSAEVLNRIEEDTRDDGDEYLNYQIRVTRGSLSGMAGKAILAELAELDSAYATLRLEGKEDEAAVLAQQVQETRNRANVKLAEGIDALSEAVASDPSRLGPKIRLHDLLKLKIMLISDDDSLKAQLMDNAKSAVAVDPTNWLAVQCLMQSHLVMANPSEALSALDQYFRRGGMSQQARAAIMEVARLEGKPGLAIPALERAMERDPADPIWPKSIANLLLKTGNIKEAAEMLWRTIELQSSIAGVAEFVRVEFMQDEPDMDRIVDALAMQEDIVDVRPDLKAAYAAALVKSGNTRQGEEMYLEAHRASRKFLETPGEAGLTVDRVYSYYDKVFPDDTTEEMVERMESLLGELGIHDYQSIASACITDGNPSPDDVRKSLVYLDKAIACPSNDEAYLKVVLDRVASSNYYIGECDAAIKALQRIATMGRVTGQTLNNLAYMMLDCNGDASGAIAYSVRALQKGPANPQYLDTHGAVLLALGRYEEAEPLIMQAVSIKASASNLIHYAELLSKTGRAEQARVVLSRIAQDFPLLSPKQQSQVNKLISSTG